MQSFFHGRSAGNWIHAPLSDLFLIYSERRGLSDNVVLDRVITAKVTRSVAF